MMSVLKNHPFAVEAFFERSLVLTYALPKEVLQSRIPPCLTLDTWEDTWAFVAVALVQTKDLRPKGFPRWIGNDFMLTGYRIFVRYTTSQGKRLRGLYILKSETNQKKMEWLGSLFTRYRYATTDCRMTQQDTTLCVRSVQSELDIVVQLNKPDVALPASSPFASWKEARRFAGPLPFTFSYLPDTQQMLLVEGVRESWTPVPVDVRTHQVGFLRQFANTDIRLANAFVIENIPYSWKKGKLDPCVGQ